MVSSLDTVQASHLFNPSFLLFESNGAPIKVKGKQPITCTSLQKKEKQYR